MRPDDSQQLAGLGFSFSPVSLQPPVGPKPSGRSDVQPSGGGSSGSGGQRALAAANSGRVVFNLRERRPGPAYSSPNTAAGVGTASPRQHAKAVTPSEPSARQHPPAGGSSLAQLKLASLRRRAAAGHTAGSAAILPAVAAAPAASVAGPCCLPSVSKAALPAEVDPAEAEPDDGLTAQLLQDMESMLAGCSCDVVDDPPPGAPLPPHVLLGLPVLASPPYEVEKSGPLTLAAAGSQHWEASQPCNDSIAAHRPAPASVANAALLPAEAASAAEEATIAEAGAQPGSMADAPPRPRTLQAALQCLGLLAQQQQQQQAEATGATTRSSLDPASSQPQTWVRLRAVQVVLASKHAAAAAELAPLVQRLRQVRCHLEFHKANLQRGRSRSPGRSTSPGAGAPPTGPWLSGRSSAQESKHRVSRSGSPGLHPRPKLSGPTPEASELQVELLGSLMQKLLLKLGLAGLRKAAEAARLQQRLLMQVATLGTADLCCAVLRHWHVAAVPSQQQEDTAARLAQQLSQRLQQAQLLAWQQWAAHHAWQQRQLATALLDLHRRLLAASVQHWRCYCQQQLVWRLQAALAARWLAAWSRRRVFAAWRLSARRSAVLKASLLLGRPSSSSAAVGAELAALPSQLEVLAATAAAFQPVKEFVAEAVQQLEEFRHSLRFSVPGSRGSSAPGAAKEATAGQLQHGMDKEPLAVGSVEELLASLAPHEQKQQQQQQAIPALPAPSSAAAAPPFTGALQAAPELTNGTAAAAMAAAAAGGGSPAAVFAVAAVPEPAPDPGSPTAGYNPSSYASPQRQGSTQQHQQQQQQQQRRRGGTVAHADRAQLAEPPAAVEAELLECQARVQQLRRELEELEQESADVQQQCTALEEAGIAAQQVAGLQREACVAAAAGKEAAASAVQEAVQHHAAAAVECSQQERRLKLCQQQSQEAVALAAGARAAAHAVTERQTMAAMGVQRWSKAVEAAAKELSACHRSQEAPVVVRLKEARQQLERQQLEAEAARQQLPELQEAAEQAARQALETQQAVLGAQQVLVLAAEQRAACQRLLDAAIGRHEAAAVAAVAAQQEVSAAEQRPRLLAAQQQAAAGRLRQAAQQVMHKQQEAVQLQQQVQVLQQRHQDAVAAELAAGQREQQRGKLKRRLQVVHEVAGCPLDSPTGVQQRRPPPVATRVGAGSTPAAPAAAPGVWAPVPAGGAAAGMAGGEEAAWPGHLTLHVPQLSDWSCCSSDLGSPLSEQLPAPPPLTVHAAADRFYCQSLLRRALRTLRLETHRTRKALSTVTDRWQRRQQLAVLRAWHAHAAEASDFLQAFSTQLRVRWLFRHWQASVHEHHWQRQAEETADAFARRHLLVAGLSAWRQHLQHELWRDAVHEEVVRTRMRCILQSWRAWTRQRRQKAARQRAALAVYHQRLLAAALRQWRWVQHSKALLHRVFSSAVELWQDEVGVRLHERNHERLQECWDTWQLALLEVQALRRQAMLWNAAAAHREKQMLLAGLQAFRGAVAQAQEERHLGRLAAHMFAAWRRLAASSVRHWEYEAARRHRQRCLLQVAVATWRTASEATSVQLAHFWLRWQVQAALRRALLGWRGVKRAQHESRVLAGMAEVHRERQLLQLGWDAFVVAGSARATQAGQMACQTTDSRAALLHTEQGGGQQQRRQQQSQQQGPERHLATVSVSVGPSPSRQRQQQHPSEQCPAAATTTTIVISRGRRHYGQEQVPPVGQAQPAAWPSAGGCRGARRAEGTAAAAAAQGMLGAVSSWRDAADFWRQRHESYSQQADKQAHPQQPPQQQQMSEVSVHIVRSPQKTAATLAELRAQQQQQRQ